MKSGIIGDQGAQCVSWHHLHGACGHAWLIFDSMPDLACLKCLLDNGFDIDKFRQPVVALEMSFSIFSNRCGCRIKCTSRRRSSPERSIRS
jgi:hypothetical protein